MQATQSLRFSRKDSKKFFRTLNLRVNQYFKENKIQKTGNWKLYLKSLVMFSLLIAPYVLVLLLDISLWYKLPMCIVMGIGMGSSIYILAGNVFNWKVQHNLLHHTYTNIHGHDEDLEAGRVLRFSKHAKWLPHHKFQHFYSVLLYGLLTINWAIFTDFQQMKRYTARKLSYLNSKRPSLQWTGLVISKVVYFVIWLVIPMIFLNAPWWAILIGFVVMHYTAGLILSLVFQLAHVMEDAEMPKPDETGTMKNTWAIHQLLTTVNFSTKNRFVNWFTGGLNHQIEHHIFPHISHIHYTHIGAIVKITAKEFNLPYNEYKTTRSALLSHFKFLKQMGVQPS